MVERLACPCGQDRPYAACCGALHRGERAAETAEELMRSRYAAFSRGEAEYLVATWHPDQQAGVDRRSLAANPEQIRWIGLTILDTVAGGVEDDTGIVEFEAHYQTPTTTGVMHERSSFVRLEGRWYYREGAAKAPGRNEPCPCGSGKKFKRCCG